MGNLINFFKVHVLAHFFLFTEFIGFAASIGLLIRSFTVLGTFICIHVVLKTLLNPLHSLFPHPSHDLTTKGFPYKSHNDVYD